MRCPPLCTPLVRPGTLEFQDGGESLSGSFIMPLTLYPVLVKHVLCFCSWSSFRARRLSSTLPSEHSGPPVLSAALHTERPGMVDGLGLRKGLSYVCPVACGCRSGDPHCPESCPRREASEPMCLASQLSEWAQGYPNPECPIHP